MAHSRQIEAFHESRSRFGCVLSVSAFRLARGPFRPDFQLLHAERDDAGRRSLTPEVTSAVSSVNDDTVTGRGRARPTSSTT